MTNKHQNKTKTAGRFSRSHSAVSIPSVPNDPNRCSFSGRVKHADCAQTSLINERVPAKLNSGFSSESVQLEGKTGRLSDLTLNLSCQVAIYCSALTVSISGFRMQRLICVYAFPLRSPTSRFTAVIVCWSIQLCLVSRCMLACNAKISGLWLEKIQRIKMQLSSNQWRFSWSCDFILKIFLPVLDLWTPAEWLDQR